MKPDWDKLMKSFNKSKRGATALIADVDCTAAGKDLCETHGVKGFPTIKWGDPSSLEDYDGGRDYEALKKFAMDKLKPMCSPKNIDLCDDEKKKEIADLQALSAEDLGAKIEAGEKQIADAEAEFKTAVEELQKTYEKMNKEKDAKVEEVKNSGLGLMKAVQAAQKQPAKEEL